MKDPVIALTRAYEAISAGAMRDLPIRNDALAVEAVDFTRYGNGWLGVMITPWFMNLTLIPDHPEHLADCQPGAEQLRALPAGQVAFSLADLPEVGRFLTCSLFSPMLEFEDQAAARLAASAALRAVSELEPAEAPPSRRELLSGRLSRRSEAEA